MGQFDKENNFVLLVARGTLSEEERTELEKLLGADLDWDYVLAQMKRHKLFPLLASHWQLCKNPKNLEAILNEVKNNCAEPIKRSRMLDAELCRIAELLTEKDITYAVLKGPILAHEIYDNLIKRTYLDIDILVKNSEAAAVSNILKEQGYTQGKFDREKKEIIAASRKDILWCNIYIHQLYPFCKIIEQYPCTVEVQIKFFHQYGNTSHNLGKVDLSNTAECWQTLRMIELNSKQIATLNWEYFLLQLCLHAYIDEVSLGGVVYGHGARLRAYCDIRELLTSKRGVINLEKFAKLVQMTETNEPVYYILVNLSELYGDVLEIVSPILQAICPNNLGFMNEFGHPWETLDEQRGQFSQTFMKRIFDNSSSEDYDQQKHLFRDPNWAKLF